MIRRARAFREYSIAIRLVFEWLHVFARREWNDSVEFISPYSVSIETNRTCRIKKCRTDRVADGDAFDKIHKTPAPAKRKYGQHAPGVTFYYPVHKPYRDRFAQTNDGNVDENPQKPVDSQSVPPADRIRFPNRQPNFRWRVRVRLSSGRAADAVDVGSGGSLDRALSESYCRFGNDDKSACRLSWKRRARNTFHGRVKLIKLNQIRLKRYYFFIFDVIVKRRSPECIIRRIVIIAENAQSLRFVTERPLAVGHLLWWICCVRRLRYSANT